MQTKDYLKEAKEKPYEFAKRARVRFETIYALARGEKPNLTRESMQRIIMASGGNIRAEDLL